MLRRQLHKKKTGEGGEEERIPCGAGRAHLRARPTRAFASPTSTARNPRANRKAQGERDRGLDGKGKLKFHTCAHFSPYLGLRSRHVVSEDWKPLGEAQLSCCLTLKRLARREMGENGPSRVRTLGK